MATVNSFSQPAGLESANINSIKDQILKSLQSSKEYRQAFVEENVRARITAQIHALRTESALDYKQFAERIDKKVSWAYRLEDPNEAPPTIPTLLEVAEAFDIGLDVRFRPFSELLNDITTLRPFSFSVPSFESELKAGVFVKPRRRRKVRRSPNRLRLVPGKRRRKAHVIAEDLHDGTEGIGAGVATINDGISNAPASLQRAS